MFNLKQITHYCIPHELLVEFNQVVPSGKRSKTITNLIKVYVNSDKKKISEDSKSSKFGISEDPKGIQSKGDSNNE